MGLLLVGYEREEIPGQRGKAEDYYQSSNAPPCLRRVGKWISSEQGFITHIRRIQIR